MMNNITQWVSWYENHQIIVYAAVIGACFLIGAVLALVKHCKQSLHGESTFASRAEIRDTGLLDGDGVVVGKHRGSYLQYGGAQHTALLAPTRSGKGVSIVVPTLLTWTQSVVVLDVKQENFNITSGYRSDNAQDVYLINPFDRITHQSNALAFLPTDPDERISEILSVGYMLYPRVTRGETMWSDTARDLFTGLVMFQCETTGTASIGATYKHMSGKGEDVKEYLQALIDNHDLSAECTESLSRFIYAPGNTAGGILTTAQAPLTLWASPIVSAATSGNDVDWRDLRRRRMSVYIGIPVNKLPEADVFLRLTFSQIIKQCTDVLPGESADLKYQVLLVMDEFMAIKYMPIIDQAISYLAGYGIRLLIVAQSKSLIAKPVADGGYGREGADALLSDCALNILFAPKNNSDAVEYSAILGDNTVKSKSVQIRNRWQGSESDQRRPLMFPQELRRMGRNTAILNLENTKPIKVKKVRYWRERAFTDRLKRRSPSLAKIRSATLSEDQIQRAWPELRAHVPTIKPRQASKTAKPSKPRQASKAAKPKAKTGIDLDKLAIELPPVVTGAMNDKARSKYVESFWSSLAPEAPEEKTTIDLANVDKDTGEIINMQLLREA